MAGDWIKMRGNLWDDPRIVALCDATDSSEAAVIGALYWLWTSADQHTEDGVMPGLSLRQIDRKTGVAGFAQALLSVGWIEEHPEGILIVRFDEHNGASAKRRASDARRKVSARDADKKQKVSASDADISQTSSGTTAELEKEKEKEKEKDIKPSLSGAVAVDNFSDDLTDYHKPDWRPDLSRIAHDLATKSGIPMLDAQTIEIAVAKFNLRWRGKPLTPNETYERLRIWLTEDYRNGKANIGQGSAAKPRIFEQGDAIGDQWLVEQRQREQGSVIG